MDLKNLIPLHLLKNIVYNNTLYALNNDAFYFDSFGGEYAPKEL